MEYIDVFAEVVLVLGLGVQSVARLGPDLGLRSFRVQEFIVDMISWAFGGLFAYMMELIP